MATPYSTETQLRDNLFKLLTIRAITSVKVEERILQADQDVQVDLSKLVDFDVVDAAVTTPGFINNLSQYKTCELCLVYVFGAKRTVEDITDITYWMQKYADLIEAIKNMEVDLGVFGLGGSTFTSPAKSGVKPTLGMDKYGEFSSDEELAEDRPLDD